MRFTTGWTALRRRGDRSTGVCHWPLCPRITDDSFDIVGCRGQCLTAEDYHKRRVCGAIPRNNPQIGS
ncbi:hypothetical protein TSH58p_00595 (plasmid) [Azospirillum sp. TSH58]|nr:hypothetical protein TSH58p_00595 [Azospirillum sp. TSH58]